MESISVKLSNGYNLVASKDYDPDIGDSISVYVTDTDGVFHQEVVRVDFENEVFSAKIFGDPDNEDFTQDFTIAIHQDVPEEEEEDIPDEDEVELPEDFEEDDKISLKYGDHGDAVKELQRLLRDQGYFNGSIGGNYLRLTESAVMQFQLDAGLEVDGICDEVTWDKLHSTDAPRGDISKPDEENHFRTAVEMDWWTSDIQKIFAKGVTAQITDVETGLTWNEQRRGGTNHADVQPLTRADTDNLKKAYGGKWSWKRRAIWVTIDGKNYAASMNGMPHGGSSIKNNGFDGHHCIHFTNSRTHCSNKVCPNHQAMIKKAANAVMRE